MANISRCSVSGPFFQKIANLVSRSREQQQGPLNGPGALLGSLAGTAVHRGWPAGQIPTPAMVATPRHRTFSPPITSAFELVPHFRQWNCACVVLLLASPFPQAGQVWLVCWAGTLTNRLPNQWDLYSSFWLMAAQRWDRIDRLRPRFCATFWPGFSSVLVAERVMLPIVVSSTAISPWLRTMSVVIRCSAACKFLMRLRSTVWSCAMTCR